MLSVMTRHTSPIARKAATARRVRIRCRSGDAAKRIAASERSSNGARAPDSNSSVSRAAMLVGRVQFSECQVQYRHDRQLGTVGLSAAPAFRSGRYFFGGLSRHGGQHTASAEP